MNAAPQPSTRHGRVPHTLFAAVRGDTTAIAVYALLATYAGKGRKAWPPQRLLADELGVNVQTVGRATRRLRDAGVVTTEPRLQQGRKVGVVYTLTDPSFEDAAPLTGDGSHAREPLTLLQQKDEQETHCVVARRDVVWDAVMAACGIEGQITKSARGAYNRAVADLKQIGASPADIEARAQGFRRRWPEASLTPTALVRRWAECGLSATQQQAVTADPVLDQVRRMRQMEGR